MSVRAFFYAGKVEDASSPYDTIHMKIFYPAQMSGSDLEQNMGIFKANSQLAPFKVVIFSTGLTAMVMELLGNTRQPL